MPGELKDYVPILVALIPALGGLVAAVLQRQAVVPRPYRRLAHLVDMLAKVPDGKAKGALDELVASSANALRDDATTLRKANPANVALTVVLAIGAGIGVYWLAQWIVVATGTGWAAVAWVVTIIVALFLALLVAAAIGTIYTPPRPRAERTPK